MNPVAHLLLSGMHKEKSDCLHLIETTAASLNSDVLAVMLLAVQRENLELSIKMAVKWWLRMERKAGDEWTHLTMKRCLFVFPRLWVSRSILGKEHRALVR